MDMITLAMAKNYTNSQRLGYVEGGEVLTFDGDITGKTLATLGNFSYVKLSDKPHDLTKLVNLGLAYDPELAEQQGVPPYIEVPKGTYTVESNADASMVTSEDVIMIVSYSRKVEGVVFDVGVYALLMPYGNKFGSWVARLEFEEIIHPIDPKFIPWNSAPGGGTGGGLPVVELSTTLDKGVPLTEEESAALNACIGLPCIIKYNGGAEVFGYLKDGEASIFLSPTDTMIVGIEGAWACGSMG